VLFVHRGIVEAQCEEGNLYIVELQVMYIKACDIQKKDQVNRKRKNTR
jgi:hypothetical protein